MRTSLSFFSGTPNWPLLASLGVQARDAHGSRCASRTAMQLLVSDGEATRLRTASLGDTVGELLARWAPAGAPSESRLSVGGRPLNTSWTLSRCGVRHGATLQLMPRMRGGTGMGAAPSWGTGPGVVLPVFEAYQAARIEFATELAKLAAPTEQTSTGAGIPNASYEVDGPEKVLASLEGIDVLAPQIVGLAADVAPQVRTLTLTRTRTRTLTPTLLAHGP